MTTWPAASTPCTWKTDFAMSRPIVVIVCMDAPPNRGSLNSAHIFGTHVPVEEPSTASLPDSCTAALGSSIRSPHRRHVLAGTPHYRVLHIGVGSRALPVATSSGQMTTCLPSCHWIVTAL